MRGNPNFGMGASQEPATLGCVEQKEEVVGNRRAPITDDLLGMQGLGFSG